MRGLFERCWSRIAAAAARLLALQSWRYWITAVAVLIASYAWTPQLMEIESFAKVRNDIYEFIGTLQTPRLKARDIKVVMIDDNVYWDVTNGASPLDRAYLAKLIGKLKDDDVPMIALDADLLVPKFDTTKLKPGDYGKLAADRSQDIAQLNILMRAIADYAEKHPIILAADIFQSDEDVNTEDGDPYEIESASYQPFGICQSLKANGQWNNPGNPPAFVLSPQAQKNIACAYIQLPDDIRQMPGLIDVHQRSGGVGEPCVDPRKPCMDSLSLAIVRIQTGDDAANEIGIGTRYITYILPSDLESSGAVILASDVMADRSDLKARPKPVIIGGNWHRPRHGDPVDMHSSPVGDISGALLHENFAEAALGEYFGLPAPDWIISYLEVFFGVGAMLLFAVYHQVWIKLALFLGLSALLLVVQWVTLHVFGTFFEAFVPLFGVAVHSILERLFE